MQSEVMPKEYFLEFLKGIKREDKVFISSTRIYDYNEGFECEVIAKGKKYITVYTSDNTQIKFHTDTGKQVTDYLPEYLIFPSQQTFKNYIIEMKEYHEHKVFIQRYLSLATLTQLKVIKETLNIKPER